MKFNWESNEEQGDDSKSWRHPKANKEWFVNHGLYPWIETSIKDTGLSEEYFLEKYSEVMRLTYVMGDRIENKTKIAPELMSASILFSLRYCFIQGVDVDPQQYVDTFEDFILSVDPEDVTLINVLPAKKSVDNLSRDFVAVYFKRLKN